MKMCNTLESSAIQRIVEKFYNWLKFKSCSGYCIHRRDSKHRLLKEILKTRSLQLPFNNTIFPLKPICSPQTVMSETPFKGSNTNINTTVKIKKHRNTVIWIINIEKTPNSAFFWEFVYSQNLWHTFDVSEIFWLHIYCSRCHPPITTCRNGMKTCYRVFFIWSQKL